MITEIIFISLFSSVFSFTSLYSGKCPSVPQGSFGICLERCSSDGDCRGIGVKCCSNGCGHECKKACPIVACRCTYKTEYYQDENGCETCRCIDPCTSVRCQAGKVCQVNPITGDPICVNIGCPGPQQSGNCSGISEYSINRNGCLECRCPNKCTCSDNKLAVIVVVIGFNGYTYKKCACVDSCQNACPNGYRCELNQVQCIRAPCPPIPQCVPIFNPCSYGQPLPNICCGRCAGRQNCPSGYECNISPIDAYALCCQNDPCNNTCASTERCVLKQVQCITTPCLPQPVCQPRECPLYKCVALDCPYGYAFDEFGCRTCGCLEPCKDKVCEKGKTCTVLKAPSCTDRECPQYYGLCV